MDRPAAGGLEWGVPPSGRSVPTMEESRDEQQTRSIIERLQAEQFIRPHQTVGEAMERAREAIGFCPDAAAHALRWLEIDARGKVGRLRRTELLQLARCLQRAWVAATSDESLTR